MRDVIFKLRLLWIFVSCAFEDWLKAVWKGDLDSRMCCDGRECGCQGSTLRDMYVWELRKAPK